MMQTNNQNPSSNQVDSTNQPLTTNQQTMQSPPNTQIARMIYGPIYPPPAPIIRRHVFVNNQVNNDVNRVLFPED